MVIVYSLEELKKLKIKPRYNKRKLEALRKRITKHMQGLPPSEVLIRRMRDARS